MKPDENGQLTKHFNDSEFRNSSLRPMDEELIIKLECLRLSTGLVIKINSGVRTEEENRQAGGTSNSQHLLGKAVDISTRGYTSEEKYRMLIEAARIGFTGIGIYDTFIHLDVRDRPAFWMG
jgi:uncharacterized protein YcbK (DUF882 family)